MAAPCEVVAQAEGPSGVDPEEAASVENSRVNKEVKKKGKKVSKRVGQKREIKYMDIEREE